MNASLQARCRHPWRQTVTASTARTQPPDNGANRNMDKGNKHMVNIDLDLLRQGNRRALAKAITLVESKLNQHREEAQTILENILPDTGHSIRIGISGIPGVGKSTFIEAF